MLLSTWHLELQLKQSFFMKDVSLLVTFFEFFGVFLHFFRIRASLRWRSEARIQTTCKKKQKQSKKNARKGTIFVRFLCFCNIFVHWFLEQSWEVFFNALMAKVSRMEATWGHFSRHVAAKLESWKLWFRVHQTLLFRALREWIRTGWATFFKIFSKRALETLFYDFLRNWGSSRSSKDIIWWAFQAPVLRWFFTNF